MRLSLRVQRQSLPPIDLLWTIKQRRGHTSPTISQLLEEVNQRIPLEAQGWGLEEYVVRVGGFECLHYSEVDDILRDGDEVSIEPLETADVRARRLGGRYQITPDGRHLIDGVSFGRRWYGQPARPTVRIPPRKRVKFTQDDDEDELDQRAEQLLKLLGNSGNSKTRGEQEDDDVNDSDWVMDEGDDSSDDLFDGQNNHDDQRQEGSSDLEEEVQALAQEAEFNEFRGKHAGPGIPKRKWRAARGKGILKGPENAAESSNKRKKRVGFVPSGSQTMGAYNAGVKTLSNVPRGLLARQGGPASEARTNQTVVSKVVELSSDEDSDASFSLSDSQTDSSESFSDSESSASNDVSPDEDSSEIESSSDDSDSARRGVKWKRGSNTRVDSSNLNKGDLKVVQIAKQLKAKDYEEEDQGAPKGPQTPTAMSTAEAESSKADTSLSSADGVENRNKKNAAATPPVVPPGEGMMKTKVRNERRRISNKIQKLTKKGLLQRGSKRADLEKLVANEGNEGMEARREKLLAAVSAGGVDVNDEELLPDAANQDPANGKLFGHSFSENDSLQTKSGTSQPQATSPSPPFSTAQEHPDDPSATDVNDSGKENVAPSRPLESAKPKQNESVRRRAKLDLAGSRRMLFGSLGVRTPQTQAEEDQLRNRLAEVGKPRRRALVTDTASADESSKAEGPDVETADAEKDPEFWKTRINLFAVECVDENIKLSTPPFPFVQRWDPQQQHPRKGSKSGGKGKKRKRNNSQYYQGTDDHQEYSEWQGFGDVQPDGDNVRLNYDGEEDGMDAEPTSKARNIDRRSDNVASPGKQLLNEMNGAASTHLDHSPTDKHIEDEDDLPPLPEDISSLPVLSFNANSQGTIIAFRKLDMSAETNYQPVLSAYRAARVMVVDPLTQYLSLKLAKRDQVKKSPRYDSEGNRIYGKFEIADDSDEESELGEDGETGNIGTGQSGTVAEGDGLLNVSFAELVEPKLVKAAETVAETAAMDEAGKANVSTGAVQEQNGDVGATHSSLAVETSESLDGQGG